MFSTHEPLRRLAGFLGKFISASLTLVAVAAAQQPANPNVNNNAFQNNPAFETRFRNVARQASASIVSIETTGGRRGVTYCRAGRGGFFRQRGTGFVTANGVIVTNSGIVSGADRILIRTANGTQIMASGVSVDPLTNTATLNVGPAVNVPALAFADSNTVVPGDWVVALGGPGFASGGPGTLSAGIVNGVVAGPGILRGEDLFQINNIVTPAINGGPLMNLNGQVVGMTTNAGNQDGLAPGGIGYAIPANLLTSTIQQLNNNNGVIPRPFIGLQTRAINAATTAAGVGAVPPGVVVTNIHSGSPAAAAGFQTGDIVLKVNGANVTDPRQLHFLARQLQVGSTYPVVVMRNGMQITLNITPVQAPVPARLAPRVRVLDTAPEATPASPVLPTAPALDAREIS